MKLEKEVAERMEMLGHFESVMEEKIIKDSCTSGE